jgi:hypothetical protein
MSYRHLASLSWPTLSLLFGVGVAAPAALAQQTVIVAPSAPPPPQTEAVPPPPTGADAAIFWQPGHWSWASTGWVWIAGAYVERPQPQATWVPGQWMTQPSGGYVWVAGHWQS